MSELTKAYARGYNAGKKRQTWYLDRIIKIAKAYRARLRSTEQEHFGDSNWLSQSCSTCARWQRGGESCRWGFCGLRFMTEVGEPAMWIDGNGRIGTHEDFGCVSWLPLRPHSTTGLRRRGNLD